MNAARTEKRRAGLNPLWIVLMAGYLANAGLIAYGLWGLINPPDGDRYTQAATGVYTTSAYPTDVRAAMQEAATGIGDEWALWLKPLRLEPGERERLRQTLQDAGNRRGWHIYGDEDKLTAAVIPQGDLEVLLSTVYGSESGKADAATYDDSRKPMNVRIPVRMGHTEVTHILALAGGLMGLLTSVAAHCAVFRVLPASANKFGGQAKEAQ